MTKIKLTQRLLAVMLGLTIAFLACACASVDAPSGESKATEESKATSALELSDINAEGTSSEAEPSDEESSENEPSTPDEHLSADAESSLSGGITITPIEPTYPEERETTLEKVMSFDIGIDGMFQYRFIYYDDPSVASVELPGDVYIGTDGKFYHYVNNASMSRLICLNDGTYIDVLHGSELKDAEIYGNTLYLLVLAGDVYQYDISNGLQNAELLAEYSVYEQFEDDVYGHLSSLGWEEPVFCSDDGSNFFSLKKEPLQEKELPFVLTDGEKTGADVQISSEPLSRWVINYNAADILSATSEQILVREKENRSGTTVFATYDKKGNVASRFACEVGYLGEKVPCEIAFSRPGASGIVKERVSERLLIGKVAFEDILGHKLFFAPNGTPYLAVYHSDHCDIYRVDAGYTSAEFAEVMDVLAEENSVAPMSNANEASASSVKWLDISRDEVEENAEAMMNLKWTIKRGNLTPRNTDTVELPVYLRTCSIGGAQTGIPYCKGGYNGVGGLNEFATIVAMAVDSQGCPTAGNVANVSGNQLCTAGLDCARFLCKSFEFTSGLSPEQFITNYVKAGYGHTVSATAQLHEWDVIVSNSHAMFFSKELNDIVYVYDVTSEGVYNKTTERSTGYTREQLAERGYRFVHMYSSVGQTSTSHFTECATCGDHRVYEPHTWKYEQVSSTTHRKVCTVCGYSSTISHTFTYPSYSTSSHTKRCSGCGYSTTETHSYTYTSLSSTTHTKACTKCNYSVSQSHTNANRFNTTHHWYGCRYCSYAINKEEHLMLQGGCLTCAYYEGAPLNGVDLPDEPSHEPPVPDAPFVVLCVPQEDELPDRIQW